MKRLNKLNKILIITAGAAGEIGTEFCKKMVKKHIDCIGIVRNKKITFKSKFLNEIVCDLTDEKQIEKEFGKINFNKYNKIILLHAIGIDKFEPRGYPSIHPMDTIPPEVYNTNVNSFKYIFKYCVKRIRKINLKENKTKFKIAIIAGVGDKYTPFVIESFCETKFILRQYIQSAVSLYPRWISGLSINISSTVTKSALMIRPNADTHYWLNPYDIVERSFEKLVSFSPKYKEIDVIKRSPDFFDGYYENNKFLYKKWSKDTGIK